MKITRRSFVSFALALLATPAFAKRRAPLMVQGTFLRIEEGDYKHLVVKDPKGKEWSFFVLSDEPAAVKYLLEHPAEYKGKSILVTYRSVSRVLPEAGPKPILIQEVTDVDLH